MTIRASIGRMWHPSERSALVTALREAGPGAPTLCAGWRAEQLAAHVVLRESSVLTAAGIVLPPLAARTEQKTQELGARSTTPEGWADLLARLEAGPARWHPLRWAGDGPQLAELFVHTEDVRRAREGVRAEPRPTEAAHAEALWRAVKQASRIALRRPPVSLVLRQPDGRSVEVGRVDGAPVVVDGEPGELLLWVFDRSRVARVRVEGPDPAVERLTHFREPPLT